MIDWDEPLEFMWDGSPVRVVEMRENTVLIYLVRHSMHYLVRRNGLSIVTGRRVVCNKRRDIPLAALLLQWCALVALLVLLIFTLW